MEASAVAVSVDLTR